MMSTSRSYSASSPIPTHFERATCEEIDCPRFLKGFSVKIPLDDDLYAGRVRAAREMGAAVEALVTDNDWTPVDVTVPPWDVDIDGVVRNMPQGKFHLFLFPPGTTCTMAAQHKKRRDREPEFYVNSRFNNKQQRVVGGQQLRGDDWLESFAEDLDAKARRRKEGAY